MPVSVVMVSTRPANLIESSRNACIVWRQMDTPPNVFRAFAAACAVGLVALTLTLGSLHHPTPPVAALPLPPLSHAAAPPVVIAPPVLAAPRHPRRETRVRVTARPHTVGAKKEAVRPAVVVHLGAATRTQPVGHRRAGPHPGKRPSPRQPSPTPRRPPVTTTPTTPPTTPVTPSPPTNSPVVNPPPTPPTTTVPVAPPPIVAETSGTDTRPGNGRGESGTDTRPGNGRGDRNHDHTGPPGHSK
jgi:hypothetical protein